MLSDACFDFTGALFDSGCSTELLENLSEQIEHYAEPSFGYAKAVLEPLQGIVNFVLEQDEEDRSEFATDLLWALLSVQRAYDNPEGSGEVALGQMLQSLYDQLDPAEPAESDPAH